MATGKRYYWIKLRESFMSSDVVDFLMSQKGGANYIVLYQLLCLKAVNTNGRLATRIGDLFIPYDVGKIQRDCKWFSADTVRIALELYKRFGMIYEDVDGTLVLADYKGMVGSETDWAKQKRVRKDSQLLPSTDGGNQEESSVENFHTNAENSAENFHTDIRDIDIRDIDTRDKEIREQKNTGAGGKTPVTPFSDDSTRRPDFNTLEVYAASNLRSMSPYNLEELVSYRDSLPDEVIRYAIDEACASGRPEYAYVRGILNRYVDSGFKTIGDIRAHDTQRRKAQRAKTTGVRDYNDCDENDPFKDW